jgi:hypothetical protein
MEDASIGLIILIAIYFLPTIIAVMRNSETIKGTKSFLDGKEKVTYHGRKNKGAIFVLNLFLGWTLIGWVVALVWAVSEDK